MFHKHKNKYSQYQAQKYLSKCFDKYGNDFDINTWPDKDLKILSFVVYLFYALINKRNNINNIITELDNRGMIKTYYMMSVKPQKVINPAPLKFVPSYLSQEEKNTIMNLSSYSTVFGRQLLSCLSKYQVTYSETKIISLITLLMQLVLINYKPIKFFKYAKDNDDHLYNFRVDCATITINYFEAIDHMVKEMIPAKNGDLLVYLNGLLETLF